jgi:hypothetical protein
MQADFDRARETAWLIGVSYSFDGLGIEGLSTFARYAEGYRAIDGTTGKSLDDRRELDLTIDYKPTTSRARGFWLRLRASLLRDIGGPSNSVQVRAILNYDIPVL